MALDCPRLGAQPAEPKPAALVFATRDGSPLRRSNFRRQVWRPALVRAGLLGKVAEVSPDKWHAKWTDATGVEWLPSSRPSGKPSTRSRSRPLAGSACTT